MVLGGISMKDNIKLYTKKDGKTYYMFKLYLGMDSETGKQIHVTRRGFLTKKEANLALAQLRVQVSKLLIDEETSAFYPNGKRFSKTNFQM